MMKDIIVILLLSIILFIVVQRKNSYASPASMMTTQAPQVQTNAPISLSPASTMQPNLTTTPTYSTNVSPPMPVRTGAPTPSVTLQGSTTPVLAGSAQVSSESSINARNNAVDSLASTTGLFLWRFSNRQLPSVPFTVNITNRGSSCPISNGFRLQASDIKSFKTINDANLPAIKTIFNNWVDNEGKTAFSFNSNQIDSMHNMINSITADSVNRIITSSVIFSNASVKLNRCTSITPRSLVYTVALNLIELFITLP